MASAIELILQMLTTLIGNTISTLLSLLGTSSELGGELGRVGGSGLGGFIVAAAVFLAVLFLLGKFIISSGKLLAVLFGIGIIILFLLFML